MKKIKIDLQINGIYAKNLQEVKDNFSIEILNHYKSGNLERWLKVRNMTTELEKLTALNQLDECILFKYLCAIFDVEFNEANFIKEEKKRNLKVYTCHLCNGDGFT